MSTDEVTIDYATEKGKELADILAGVACEFATTATLTLIDAPKLLFKESNGLDFTTVMLSPDSVNHELKVEEVQRKEEKEKAGKSWMYHKKTEMMIHREAALEEQLDRFESLRETMPLASFGHGSKTKCDTGVRDALQLPADRFKVMVSLSENETPMNLGEALTASGVLEEVQKNLGIDSERFDLVAEQYSLNMYGKGGHFKKHKDTPRGSDMIGTLLVQLPGAYYEGGALEISVGDGLKKKLVLEGNNEVPGYYHMWDQFVWKQPDSKELRVAAFFCDIDHEVLKVVEGLRLTVAFILRIKDTTVSGLPSADLNSTVLPKRLSTSEKENALAAKFVELCKDESFLPENPIKVDVTSGWGRQRGEESFEERPTFLAFPCFHLYTNAQVFPKKKESSDLPLTPGQVAMLKGKDAVIGKAVLSAAEKTGGSVKIYLQPMVDHEYTADSEQGAYLLPKFPAPKFKIPRRMSDDTIESKFKITGCVRNISPIWVIDEEMGHKPDKIGGTEWNAEGYFGNEASYIDFYVKSLLKVEFGPYVEREKLIQKAQDRPNKENRAPAPKRKVNISAASKPKKAKMTNPGHLIVSRGTSP